MPFYSPKWQLKTMKKTSFYPYPINYDENRGIFSNHVGSEGNLRQMKATCTNGNKYQVLLMMMLIAGDAAFDFEDVLSPNGFHESLALYLALGRRPKVKIIHHYHTDGRWLHQCSDKTWVGINISQNNLEQEDVRVWNLYQAVLVTWVCSQVYPNEKAKSMLCETLSGSVTSKVMNQSCVDKILGGNLPPEIARGDIFKTQ